jgi:DNA-binding beta-propeller fold protein YncE
MAQAPNGKLYVTETGGSVAEVNLGTGEIRRIAEGLAGPEGIDVGADSRVYVAEATAGRVVAIDPKDGSRTVLAEGLETGLPSVAGMPPAYTVTGLAVSKKDGAVYVSSDITNAIYKLTPKPR